MPRARRRRDPAPWVLALLLLVVPLSFDVAAAVTDDGREPGDLVTGPELVQEIHHALAGVERGANRVEVDQALFDLIRRDRRTVGILVEAAHPTFDPVRDEQGFELWRLERAFFLTGNDDLLEPLVRPWLASDDETLTARADFVLQSTPVSGAALRQVLVEIANPATLAWRHAVLVRRLMGFLPRDDGSLLLALLEDVDPGRPVDGFGALCLVAIRRSGGRPFETIAEPAQPMVPAVARFLETRPDWFKTVSRLLVDLGPAGQQRILEHATRASIDDQLEIAEDFATSPLFSDDWLGLRRRVGDRTVAAPDGEWFQSQARLLAVPALVRGSLVQKRRALRLLAALRVHPGPLTDVLAPLLGDTDDVVRGRVVDLFLLNRVAHPDLDRMLAITIETGDPASVLKTLERVDEDGLRRQPAIMAAAISVTSDASSRIRLRATTLIGRAAPASPGPVVRALTASLSDPVAGVRIEAAGGLVRYRRAVGGHAAAFGLARDALSSALAGAEGIEAERLQAALDVLRLDGEGR